MRTTYHRIENLLKTGRDKATMPEPDIPCPVTVHDNVRGAGYYQ